LDVNRNALEIGLQTGGEMFGQSIFGLKDKSPEISWPKPEMKHHTPSLSSAELDELAQLLRSAAQRTLTKYENARIGLALSGGVDSSLLLYLIKDVFPNSDVTAYHTDWKYAPRSELKFAEMAADFTKTPLKMIDVSPTAQIPHIDEALSKSLTMSYTAIPVYMTFKTMADDGIDVAINALGLDELFAGYTVHRRFFKRSRLQLIPHIKRFMNLRPYRYASLKLGTGKAFFFSQNIPYSGTKYVLDSNVNFNELYSEKIESENLWTTIHNWILWAMVSNFASSMIRPADATGVDILFPYMDHELMAKSFSYNPQAKFNKAPIRLLMREAFGFPEELASRGEQWDKIGWGGTIAPYLASKEYLKSVAPSKSNPNDWFTSDGMKDYRTFPDKPSVRALHMALFLRTLELV
jgi:asparagine synthetase B (glutamine-hydrolysing)